MSIRYNGEKIAGKYKSQTIYPASENEAGIIQIASSQDVKDGTDNTKAVTPRRLKTNYATKEELNNKQDLLVSGTNIKTLNNESLLGEGNIDITSAQWGNIDGEITNQTDLQNILDEKQNVISDINNIRTNAKTGADLAPQVAVNTQRIEDLTTARIPDVIYHGTPKIVGGQVSNFSTVNYLQFPFEDISRSLPFDIYFSFTTDDDVTTQQNIIDSRFGIALAIQNAKGVMALSSNGISWDIGSVTGTNAILPNTTYYVKYSWTGSEYNASLSTNDQSYVPDMILQSNKSPYKTTIYIGGSEGLFGPNTAHPFKGIINFSKSKVDVNGITVWEGMADVGIASRANVSLTNLDEVGEKRFSDLQTAIDTKANDADVVHKTGDETINGVKTFNNSVTFTGSNISKLITINNTGGSPAIRFKNGTVECGMIGLAGNGRIGKLIGGDIPNWESSIVRSNWNSATGSTTKPVYIDANGIAQPITSYEGNSATATKATQDGDGNVISTTYLKIFDIDLIEGAEQWL